jgi:hypothetical protein
VFVRWDNLKIEEDEGQRLPGYRDAAVVRTFDAPEALARPTHTSNIRLQLVVRR